MAGHKGAWAALFCLFTLVGAGCGKENPAYCTATKPCTNPATPYCDLTGKFAGYPNLCTAQPQLPGPTDLTPEDIGTVGSGFSASAGQATSEHYIAATVTGPAVAAESVGATSENYMHSSVAQVGGN